MLRKLSGQVKSFRLNQLQLKSLAVKGRLETLSFSYDVSLDLQKLMQLFINIFKTLFEVLVFFANCFVFVLQIADKKLVELVLAVGKNQTRPITFDLLNHLEPVFNWRLIDFGPGFVFYLLLQLCDYLLVFSHLVLVLVFFVVYLRKFFFCLLLVSFYLFSSLLQQLHVLFELSLHRLYFQLKGLLLLLKASFLLTQFIVYSWLSGNLLLASSQLHRKLFFVLSFAVNHAR